MSWQILRRTLHMANKARRARKKDGRIRIVKRIERCRQCKAFLLDTEIQTHRCEVRSKSARAEVKTSSASISRAATTFPPTRTAGATTSKNKAAPTFLEGVRALLPSAKAKAPQDLVTCGF